MLLIRILPGLMPETSQLPLSDNAEGAAGFLLERKPRASFERLLHLLRYSTFRFDWT